MVWHYAHIRRGAIIAAECVIGRGVYIDVGVRIGCRVKIQNYACIYAPCTIGDRVFIGPHAIITNDRWPRSCTLSGSLKQAQDWDRTLVTIADGASIGAGAIILPGVTIGQDAMIGAGAVVTKSVAPKAIVVGVPGRVVGFIGEES